MQGPHNFSPSHHDDPFRSAVATDMKQVEPVQHDSPPTTVTDHEGAETTKPAFNQQVISDQEQHEKGEIRDRKRTPSLDQLLKERSEELTTAQKFLGKADSISSAEVVRLVEVLNAEIAHQSTFILDSLTYQKWTGSANDLEHSLKELRDLLGPWLYERLWHRLNDPNLEFDESDDFLTQLVLQTGLTNACKYIINHWYPPFWNEGKMFDRVYGDMGRKVSQVVAGKWRALSSTHLVVDRKANKDYLRGVLRNLITAVGGPVQNGNSLPPDLKNKVDDITRKALAIHEHVKSSFTSMDLEVYSIPCGTPFDASQMEDADGPNAGGKGKAENDVRQDKVMCTVEMGLLYKKRVSSGNQGEFRDEVGIIMKSRVALVDARDAPRITESCRQL
ncbi:hypothetical protein M378DRAFT_172672 [Amanita muscaria Koide BX008]|uniref:Uncharacterized protein n=1 Tax=Amanita muscaria (strain Koide BX008) TaxID=946122 RepID=A0A0C2S1D1_AMAMK|nr:hypothetical protein M378DRAFT_172672 [Amanita muscaria Koide BX008]